MTQRLRAGRERHVATAKHAQGDGQTLTLNGTTYAKGLGAHADSDVRYPLGGTCTRFKASVGVDDEVGAERLGRLRGVRRPDQDLRLGLMTGTTRDPAIDVSVAGAERAAPRRDRRRQRLDYDHADWALARIECGSDTTAPTITGRTPAPGASGVAVGVSPTATFSEAMNPSHREHEHLHAHQAGAADSGLRARLLSRARWPRSTRRASLDASTTYTATVKGGARRGRGRRRQPARGRCQLELHHGGRNERSLRPR